MPAKQEIKSTSQTDFWCKPNETGKVVKDEIRIRDAAEGNNSATEDQSMI